MTTYSSWETIFKLQNLFTYVVYVCYLILGSMHNLILGIFPILLGRVRKGEFSTAGIFPRDNFWWRGCFLAVEFLGENFSLWEYAGIPIRNSSYVLLSLERLSFTHGGVIGNCSGWVFTKIELSREWICKEEGSFREVVVRFREIIEKNIRN